MGPRQVFKAFCFTIAGLVFLVACQSSASIRANAGADFSVKVGVAPIFDGCASTGEIVNYHWEIIEAPDKMSDDVGKMIREIDPNCSFTLDANMGVDEIGEWVIELEVSDSNGNTSTDTVLVDVLP
jgi:hypothetical protein